MKRSNKIGLALGGGGARGIAHIHVLKAIDHLGLQTAEIAASSIGAIVGAGYAAGMSGRDIEEHFRAAFMNSSKVYAKLWSIRPTLIETLSREKTTVFGQLDVQRVLEVFLPAELPHDFADLKIPLTVTGTDYYGNSLKCLKSGDLRQAIAASAAIPFVFKPVIIDGCVLVDGGIVNPLPFDILTRGEYPVVAVDVVGLPRGERGKLPGRIDAAYGASQLMMQSITNLKLEHDPPEVFIRPPVDKFRVLDFLRVDEILEHTRPVYEEAKRDIDAALEASKPRISA